MTLPRHTLVFIARGAHGDVIASADDDRARAATAGWLSRNRPLIVRRTESLRRDEVALGLPLPPSQGKRRIALWARRSAIDCAREPPSTVEIRDRLPVSWRILLSELDAAARAQQLTFRVVGSAMWQALTGLCYLTPDSDLDLLWRVEDVAAITPTCRLLATLERRLARRVDCELLFADGAVSWREWWTTPDDARVLVKRIDRVRLESKRGLMPWFAREAASCAA
jgi:phosphoribosyl-dephospho-CoA transferase